MGVIMRKRRAWLLIATWLLIGMSGAAADKGASPRQVPAPMKKSLFAAREAVWRAFFANDRATLDQLIPADLITIEASGNEFGHRTGVLESAAWIARSGVKLASLEFPKTEIQLYGNTAILYSTYRYELEKDGKRTPSSGRATEVFVFRKGHWVNPGWHLDAGPQQER